MRIAHVLLGLFFVGTGLFKVFGAIAPQVPSGLSGFAEFLEAAGVPFPMLGAVSALLVEIVGGAVVAASAFAGLGRAAVVASAALAFDMLVALVTVGVPTALGQPVMVRGAPASNESWRLALELVMFVAMIVLTIVGARREMSAWRTHNQKSSTSS